MWCLCAGEHVGVSVFKGECVHEYELCVYANEHVSVYASVCECVWVCMQVCEYVSVNLRV